jgi:hypothetical protein
MAETEPANIATLWFTQLAILDELGDVRKQMVAVRADRSLTDSHRVTHLVRLFEVHNRLEVELIRQQEQYLKSHLESLKLADIGAKPMLEGKLKCHVTQTSSRFQKRAVSYGFFDQGARDIPVMDSASSGILLDRRREIREELYALQEKVMKTAEDEEHIRRLQADLRAITKI